jgi:hypothetical protein
LIDDLGNIMCPRTSWVLFLVLEEIRCIKENGKQRYVKNKEMLFLNLNKK